MSAIAVQGRTERSPGWRIQVLIGILALVVVAAGVFAMWYRSYYNIWPGQDATARVHWCERNYQNDGGPPQTWQQVNRDAPVRAFGTYPPLGIPRQPLLARLFPHAVAGDCAVAVYLRIGPDQYQSYSLLGGF